MLVPIQCGCRVSGFPLVNHFNLWHFDTLQSLINLLDVVLGFRYLLLGPAISADQVGKELAQHLFCLVHQTGSRWLYIAEMRYLHLHLSRPRFLCGVIHISAPTDGI